MKLVMFGIDYQKNLIIQFPVVVQPYMQTKLTLYQVETVPVPILDASNKIQSYSQLKIEKSSIALNDETYISIHPQELNNCKKIGYEYFCEELFVVKSKHRYSCASAAYFNSNHDIKENCDFYYYHNKTNVMPSVLDGGKQIILANWPNYKRIICTYNNNIPVNIPSHPYVLMDRNLAFVDYLKQLNETITTPINRNWTSAKQPILISLDSFQVSSKLMHMPIMLKDFMEQYQENRITVTKQENPKSKFRMFINSFLVDTLIFIAAILTMFLAFVIIYVLTGQSKLKALMTTMTLQRVRAMEALNTDRQVQSCNSGLLEVLIILNLVIVASLLLRKSEKNIFFQGQPFSNMVKIKLFLAYTKSYVSLHLNQLAGNTHLFKLTGELSLENITLKKNWIWDVLEIKWGNICIVLNNKEVHLPTTLLVPFIHKLKVRKLFGKRDLLHVYIMLKQRKSWYNLESEQK